MPSLQVKEIHRLRRPLRHRLRRGRPEGRLVPRNEAGVVVPARLQPVEGQEPDPVTRDIGGVNQHRFEAREFHFFPFSSLWSHWP